jgi:hypothetical protein
MMKKFHGPDPRVESLERESKNSKSKKKRGKMSEEDEKKASCNGIWIQLYMVQVKSIQDLTLRFIKVGFASCELVESWRAVVARARSWPSVGRDSVLD